MIERPGAKRVRARLPARPLRADRQLGRLDRRDRGARAGGRRRPRARPSARWQDPRAGRRGRARAAARSSRSRTRTRTGSRTRCARSSRASPTRSVGYVCGQVRFVDEAGKNMEGLYWRYEMWIRSLESRLAGVTGGNGAIYAVRKERLPRRRPAHGPRPVVPVQHGQARPPPGLRAARAGDGEDGPDDRGRVRPQAPDDGPRVADRPARRPALAARVQPAVRARDLQPPGAALPVAVPAPGRARAPTSRSWARARSTSSRSRSSSRCSSARSWGSGSRATTS